MFSLNHIKKKKKKKKKSNDILLRTLTSLAISCQVKFGEGEVWEKKKKKKKKNYFFNFLYSNKRFTYLNIHVVILFSSI